MMKISAHRHRINNNMTVELLISGRWIQLSPPKTPKEVFHGKSRFNATGHRNIGT